MKIYKNAIETDRAFIHFDNIQHFSWTKYQEGYEIKIYSNAGYILQQISKNDFNKLLLNYITFKKVID